MELQYTLYNYINQVYMLDIGPKKHTKSHLLIVIIINSVQPVE